MRHIMALQGAPWLYSAEVRAPAEAAHPPGRLCVPHLSKGTAASHAVPAGVGVRLASRCRLM